MDYRKLDKKAMWCMYIRTFIGMAVLSGIIIVVMKLLPFESVYLSIAEYIVFAIITINLIAGPYFKYHIYEYHLDEDSIDIREGFISIERSIVPIERLHNIEISQGPILKLFGLSNLTVITAGSSVDIKMLNTQTAEDIAISLRNKINKIAVTDFSEKEVIADEC